MYARKVESPVGPLLLLSSHDELQGLYFGGHERGPEAAHELVFGADVPVLRRAEEKLRAYFDGVLHEFDLPLRLVGTEFQREVWRTLLDVPYGMTTTYGALAKSLGRTDAVRAVAGAVARNPISIIVPCHRVVGARGQLTGYAGGLERKRFLLTHERRHSPPGGRRGRGNAADIDRGLTAVSWVPRGSQEGV
ncbi:MAG: methylated-DNA--protein-cysteine methyltransferase [Fimbriimonadales bacterium]